MPAAGTTDRSLLFVSRSRAVRASYRDVFRRTGFPVRDDHARGRAADSWSSLAANGQCHNEDGETHLAINGYLYITKEP